MGTNTRKVEGRIRKLLAMAQTPGPEGDQARIRAHALATHHRVDLARLEQPGADSRVEARQHEAPSNAHWYASLAWAIAPYAHVRVVRTGKLLEVIGTREDIDLWASLFERSRLEIEQESQRYAAALPTGLRRTGGDGFRKGAATGFGERLEMHRQQTSQTTNRKIADEALGSSTSTALVLVGREEQVVQTMHERWPKLSSLRTSTKDKASRAAGHRFGLGLGIHRGNLS
jgi:hypothetical protein